MKISHFFPGTELVVTGSDPERADMSNPRGDIFGYAGYVYAEDAEGNRKRLHVCTRQQEQDAKNTIQKLSENLTNRLTTLGKDPVSFEKWEDTHPAYGSEAYDPAHEAKQERSADRSER